MEVQSSEEQRKKVNSAVIGGRSELFPAQEWDKLTPKVKELLGESATIPLSSKPKPPAIGWRRKPTSATQPA